MDENKIYIDGFPRRNRIDHYVPAETAIRNAVLAVEVMPADVRLTEAVILLGQAQEKVADFVDEQIKKGKELKPVEETPVPTIGRIVLYTLTDQDADRINKRRNSLSGIGADMTPDSRFELEGGNKAAQGDVFPMIIVKVWGSTPGSAVNGQVFLDGNDTLWVTSKQVGVGAGTFGWPKR